MPRRAAWPSRDGSATRGNTEPGMPAPLSTVSIVTLPSSSRTVLEPGGGSRRWLTLLLAVEGLVALAASITFVTVAPDAGAVLPALGATGGFAESP